MIRASIHSCCVTAVQRGHKLPVAGRSRAQTKFEISNVQPVPRYSTLTPSLSLAYYEGVNIVWERDRTAAQHSAYIKLAGGRNRIQIEQRMVKFGAIFRRSSAPAFFVGTARNIEVFEDFLAYFSIKDK